MQPPQRFIDLPVDAMCTKAPTVGRLECRLEVHAGHEPVAPPQTIERLEGSAEEPAATASKRALQRNGEVMLAVTSLQPGRCPNMRPGCISRRSANRGFKAPAQDTSLLAELHGDMVGPHELDQLTYLVGTLLRHVRSADKVHLSVRVSITEVGEGFSLSGPLSHEASASACDQQSWRDCITVARAPHICREDTRHCGGGEAAGPKEEQDSKMRAHACHTSTITRRAPTYTTAYSAVAVRAFGLSYRIKRI